MSHDAASPAAECRTQTKTDCSGLDASNMDRRQFLFTTGAAVTTLLLADGSHVQAQQAKFERRAIGKLSEIEVNKPSEFQYPTKHPFATNTLVRLNEPAGGGVGPNNSIVAFNNICPHLGATMSTTFDGVAGIAGPCPLHWTTFDLSRHGMVISGHATISLPQIQLEVDGDDIYAVGVIGLIYGTHNNFGTRA